MSKLMILSNPKRRRRRSAAKAKRRPSKRRRSARRGGNAVSRAVARAFPKRISVKYRRNPSGLGGLSQITGTVKAAAIGASGALGLDILLGLAPLPDNLKTGPMKHLVKGAGAVLVGMAASKVVGKSTATELTQGALTVILHDAMREQVVANFPALALGMLTVDGRTLGYINPAPLADEGGELDAGDFAFADEIDN